ncbi:unnamed protein product [Peniophora sp. CBMAI 1063]|nr:unnamed protein product [Peniophora sp. CBMAI 1063]
MVYSRALTDALEKLNSDKVKARTEGLAALRAALESDAAIARLDPDGKNKEWLHILQALFSCVSTEKSLALKKTTKSAASSSATAERRAAEAARTTRWLIERATHRFNKKTANLVLMHLANTSAQGNMLYAPVALDYAKAIRAMLAHAPHADHLKDEMWERLAQLSWNTVLGDSLRQSIDEIDEDADVSVMDVDLETSAAEDELPGSGIKRRRTADERASSSKRARTAASLEQIEFCSLLATLHNLPSAPLCTPTPEGEDVRADALLAKHAHFLSSHAPDGSLHADHLSALLGTLSRVALNRSRQTCAFAKKAWPHLLALWSGRNRALKRSLLPVLRELRPFYAASRESESGLADLWGILETDRNADTLSIDVLGLRLGGEEGPFATRTFRHGRGFSVTHASAWVALEMQADCASKLLAGEVILQTPTPRTPRGNLATRRNDPLSALLSGRPSTLLIFIAHYWSALQSATRTKVQKTLLQSVSSSAADNLGAGAGGEKAAWAFLSLAAIVDQETPCAVTRDRDDEHEMNEFWPTVWAHALRRLSHPLLSRPAAHTAHALLTHGFIPPHTLRPSLLSFARDLPVQAPPTASDSVCSFLSASVKAARGDVSLFRAGVGEAVLGWVTDMDMLRTSEWAVPDVLKVFVHACGFKEIGTDGREEEWWEEDGERGEEEALPECEIVELVRRAARERQIREYLLEAQIPPFVPMGNESAGPSSIVDGQEKVPGPVKAADRKGKGKATEAGEGGRGSPGAKERKVSASMLKLLESLQAAHDVNAQLPAHKARLALQSAVLALCFEAALAVNGINSNERVLRAAAKLVQSHAKPLSDRKWSDEELIEVLSALEPLVNGWGKLNGDYGDYAGVFGGWEVMRGPSPATGVARETLRRLGVLGERKKGRGEGSKALQRMIWQSAELQDTLSELMKAMQKLLDHTLVQLVGHTGISVNGGFVDDDGFGAIRAAPLAAAPSETQLHSRNALSNALFRILTAFLARGPVLQSTSGAASRERALTDALLRTGDAEFLHAFPSYIAHVRARTLALAPDALDQLIEKFGGILMQHAYSEHAPALCSAIALFDGTMHLWLAPDFDEKVLLKVQELLYHLGRRLYEDGWHDWRVRDALGAFFARYIIEDPMEDAWYQPEDGEDEEMAEEQAPMPPFRLIMRLNADCDIRVRVRVSGPSAELLRLETRYGLDEMTVYEDVKDNLTFHLTNYQHMLTRILALGNATVVSGAVARGPYWHMLETCIFTAEFNAHVSAVFKAIAMRMGLPHHRLFETYAGQIAWTIAVTYPDKQAEQDFLLVDPTVLGYKDQRAFATASFRPFAPAYIFLADSAEQRASGRARFARHCSASGLSVAEGVRAAFADIVASDTIFCIMNDRQDFEDRLRTIFDDWGGFTYDPKDLIANADAVLVAILRQLRGEEHQAIVATAEARLPGRSMARCLLHILHFRAVSKEHLYHENLPAEAAEVIFDAQDNIALRLPAHTITPAVSYHIMQQLIADIYTQPLVNEQLRVTCALAFWVAGHWRHFREPMLLHALSHAASLLLAHADLVRAAQGLLGFAFYLYSPQCDIRSPPLADARLCDVLIRICSTAADYSDAGDDELSADLTGWLHDELGKLLEYPGTRQHALRAIVAWPREVPPQFEVELQHAQNADEDASTLNLTAMLADPRITVNKFRIVRRLAAVPMQPDNGHFARLDFWRLKECIPPRNRLGVADMDAFATLVFAHAGVIHGFGTHPLSPQVERHLPSRVKKSGPGGMPDANELEEPERIILEYLLCALDGADPRQTQAAYAVLRTAPATQIPDLKGWHREFASEWGYFAAAPRTAREAAPYSLERLPEFRPLARTFPSWVCAVTSALCDAIAGGPGGRHGFFAQLPPMLREDAVLATQTLPVLVHTLLQHDHGKGDARRHLSAFFANILAAPDSDTPTLKAIVDIALHMRNFYPHNHGKDMLANERWLDIDHMLLSRAALRCGAYTTALLFYELEFARDSDDERPKSDDADVEDILFEIYSHVDEPDGFYGIQTHDLQRFLLRRFQHERQWDRAFMFHGAAFEAGGGAMTGVRDSLHAFGFDRLASSIDNGEGEGVNYALGWRTEAWDLPDVAADDDPDVGLYRALRVVHRTTQPPSAEDALRDAVDRLRRLGDEDLVGIRQAVRGLLCAYQLRAWCTPALQEDVARLEVEPPRWESFLDIGPGFDFETTEHLFATRMSLLSAVRQRAQRAQIGDRPTPFTATLAAFEKQCLVRVSSAARDAGALQVALNSVVRAQRLDASEKSPTIAQEFANVLWAKGEHKLAIEFLRKIVKELPTETDGDTVLLEQYVLRSRLGSWSSEACMEKPAVIWESYFQPAIDHLQTQATTTDNAASAASAARIFHECAVFADRHYHALLRSPDIVRRRIYVDRKEQEVRDLESQQRRSGLSQADARDLSRAKKLLQADTAAFAQHMEAQRAFLYQAATLYARSLSHSALFDDDAHVRLVSLWYANFDSGELAEKLGRALDDVPSHKFVFLSHQLTARLAKVDSPEPGSISTSRRKSRTMDSPSPAPPSPSQGVLQRLVLRMCEDHPFHTVYQLFPLRPPNSEALSEGRRASGRLASQSQTPSQGVRAAAAGDIFARLHEGRAAQRVSDVKTLCEASLTWAKFSIKEWVKSQSSSKLKVPVDITLPDIPQKIKVPISTARTPLDPSGRYDNCVWLESYERTFTVAGGNNIPKIHACHGSDGKRYVQLFKGEGDDDMRQDAVMEQVFDLVNIALRQDRETKRRGLNIRTYCVLPLAEQAGILEFVQNTTPLSSVLRRLHKQFRPGDMAEGDFSAEMKKKRDKYGRGPLVDLQRKMLELWKNIKPRLRPVLRHWFIQAHKVPMSWFAMRLNYARSLATMSIIGHMLGLGDRHTSNILLDTSTGEAVNIDLGIAFDQGKMLPVPELVPFRLTEDMVDGLGTSGTQGVFQRCAEETLRVLRADREVVLTILEVFKYDPLHSWVANDNRLTRVQDQQPAASALTNHAVNILGGVTIDMNSANAEEAADRALSAVTRKLDTALSVEHTVNELIHEASDPANLCMMYTGWSPYH